MKKWTILLAAAAAGLVASASARAQEVTLKLHQMLPAQATIPAKALAPWADKVMKESNGRIKIDLYPSMQLGGKPPELVDQLRDGVIDLTWTVIGYTPGRFPSTEAFELPFMMTNGEQTSKAFHEYCMKYCTEDFKDYHVIAWHTHGPGLIHSKDPVKSLEDMKGMKLRGGTRVVNQMLEKLGAVPVGMPVTAVAEALSKGVINGTTIPFEVAPAFKVDEIVTNITGFAGKNGLYTATFVFAMNKDSYDKLPDDLKKVIDDNSGIETAGMFGAAMDAGDVRGREIAEKNGDDIITLDEAETQRWKDIASPLVDAWAKEMDAGGRPGTEMVNYAREMLDKYSAQ
ncbi:C4-dicarboxylate ABC transporter [Zhengella mangrovi]|uniref:C4-dicarboxylate ABC transporter n=1 Tax=Zhengella mangrovi TaxID=1982044 RepID=A0A2G1QUV3_9HYPH|nr:TRAP transporter substrate-binding protein [Zhengella mangrovi]PHP68978.1 C4-dicarboxylate ABC transporter [Zhengella mangrovi]